MMKLIWVLLICTMMAVTITAQPSGIPYLTTEMTNQQESPSIQSTNLLKPNAEVKSELSTIWTAITLNMIAADVLSTYIPEEMEEWEEFADGNEEELMMGGAIMYQIPVSMVVLSKLLPYKANRMANLISAGLMTVAVIGGGSTTPHYLVIAGAEVVGFSMIALKAWKWKNSEEVPGMNKHDIGMNLNPQKHTYGLTYTYNF